MEKVVTKQHAHPNTVLHCLYGFYCLGYSQKELAHIYNKDVKTLGNWIHVYEPSGTFERAQTVAPSRFSAAHRQWLCKFFDDQPLAYVDEAQDAFKATHCMTISKSSVWRIIHECGLTRKVLERRAMHIKERGVSHFVEELSHVDWNHHNVVFLDEVSFDNRKMIRKRGHTPKGQTVAVRGDFQRKPRVSALAFIVVNGLLDFYDTDSTFDCVEFVKCCMDFAYATNKGVRQYPGAHSVWIMDGAAIHRHPEIVRFLRSIGVVVIFLPAYCPFFNLIEYLFVYIKKTFQRHYNETRGRDLLPFVVKTFQRFENFNIARVFEHCGWKFQGHFDPTGPMLNEKRRVPDINYVTVQLTEDEEDLRFTQRRVSL
ncbi:hypothetical protein P3T76_012060 [Phytophthora citrophthora]|uniref:Tc1-like transposase DDE domain-containing protein n=1 Tax=Phytophthora citrophthora TaxID=4793 RepID=A0AAD9G5Z9_9STRA|nr:hypothetical protein P3T76_012060 [Phytophthora citrophthora]